ncbi:hypothetical protein Pan258_30170 [Symmachiella dynata]|uniref:carboxypeptidase regulatory-like domain-containing protein n=1 Tax=Symmachiella dynata TaxID=2527995 RepID=UPI00118C32F3|nr:carboxypeptidase regulatory-like domain-containing protein [Symmachiella dynata]QDT48970.1 hypothetical protein Pan258_30170 [Symmachiella dynata]
MTRVPRLFVATFMAMLVTMTGCGGGADTPKLGTVHGMVTMDGQPVSGVLVFFQPDGGGPQSIAKVNDDGSYTAIYYPVAEGAAEGVEGVSVGPCTVKVNHMLGYATRGKIPEKYGAQSELKLEVLPGDNPFDIAMESR